MLNPYLLLLRQPRTIDEFDYDGADSAKLAERKAPMRGRSRVGKEWSQDVAHEGQVKFWRPERDIQGTLSWGKDKVLRLLGLKEP